jgi:hypothetical protein
MSVFFGSSVSFRKKMETRPLRIGNVAARTQGRR